MRYIFVEYLVRDGYREYHLNELIATKAKSIELAVLWDMVRSWGYGQIERPTIQMPADAETRLRLIRVWFDGEIVVRVSHYQEIREDEYNILNKYI